jgi:hypothetical protein
MALFLACVELHWELYWELHWELYWREGEGAAGGELFFGQEARGKEIARRKGIADALKREQTHLYFKAQSSS